MKNQPPGSNDSKKFPYKNSDYSRRKEWLSRFGGIKVFRDNFRVRPYGETGDDWLRLGERKARSPGGAGQAPTGFRFGPNQLSGGINISRIKNLQLEDKSSREGIKENDTFRLFKNVVLEIIALLEEDRNHTFYPLAELYKVENKNESKKQRGKEVADRLNKNQNDDPDTQPTTTSTNGANAAADAQDLAAAYAVQEEEIEDKNEEIKILRSLASAGLITAAAAHELRALENNLSTRTKDLRELIQPFIKDEQLRLSKEEQNPFILLDDMEKTDYSIKEWLNYALMPLKRDRRKLSSIYLNDYFDGLKQNWSNLLKERRIALNIQSEDDALVRLFPIDLDTIFNNLIINSVESFARKRNRDSRSIEITCKSSQKRYLITYRDNGAGLDEGFKTNPSQIFLPQKTTKRDSTGKAIGTGMGMYLVKSIVDESKGEINIIDNPDGFTLTIELPRGAKP
jgi:signal transduction histidine kinase